MPKMTIRCLNKLYKKLIKSQSKVKAFCEKLNKQQINNFLNLKNDIVVFDYNHN